MKKAVLGILAVTAIPAFALAAASAGEPLPVDQAFAISASQNGGGSLSLKWDVANGYYLYRDRISARSFDGTALAVVTSPGMAKDDPYFGPSEVYYDRAEAILSAKDDPVEITYQGCQENGICYAPETRLVDPVTLAITDPAPTGPPVAGQIPQGNPQRTFKASSLHPTKVSSSLTSARAE